MVHARTGDPRVLLPPLNARYPKEAVREAREDASGAIERLRRRYPDFNNLEIVSQQQYLLQAVRSKGGQYTYQLSPEPGWVPYSSGLYEGSLEARTEDGLLAVDLKVMRDTQEVLRVSAQWQPGRAPVVFGQRLSEGNALFAILTVDTPDSTPNPSNGDALTSWIDEEGQVPSGTGEDDPDHTPYLVWDTPPRLIHYSQPDYPEIAQRAGVEGYVTFHVVIGPDGRVEQVRVAEQAPHRIFEKAAREAIMKWRYTSAVVDGRPVRALFSQTVQFVLSENGWSHYR